MTKISNDVMDYKVVANKVNEFRKEMMDYVMMDYNDAISSVNGFVNEYGDDFIENKYLCGTMMYDYDIRKMWADWAWCGDVCQTFDDAYSFYDDNKDMFISMEDIDDFVRGLDGTDDVGDGECLVWVKNPYYVDTNAIMMR